MGKRRVVWVVAAVAIAGLLSACSDQGPSAAAYSSRLSAAFDADEGGDLSQTAADCVARKFVALAGTSRLRAVVPVPDAVAIADLDALGVAGRDLEELLPSCQIDIDDVDVAALAGLPGQIIRPALAAPYARAIGSFVSFDGSGADLNEEQAACVGRALVAAEGIGAFARLGTPAELIQAGSLAAAGLEVTVGAADAFGPALAECGLSLRSILGPAFARVSDQRVASCILGSIDESELSRFGYVTLVAGGLGSSGSGPDAVVVDVPLEGCGFFGSADRRAYVDAVAAGLAADLAFPADDAQCVADNFVTTITPDALKRAGINPPSFRAGDVTALRLGEAAAAALVHAFDGCGQPAVDLIVQVLYRYFPIDGEQRRCIQASLDPAVATDLAVSMVTGDTSAVGLDSPSWSTLVETFGGCGITGDQLGGTPPRRPA